MAFLKFEGLKSPTNLRSYRGCRYGQSWDTGQPLL